MACVSELHINDERTSIELTITECLGNTVGVVDITNADSLTVRFQKSDVAKTTIDKPASIFTGGVNGDGTDGIVQYVTEAGLLDVVGTWKVQAIVSFPNSSLSHSTIESIKVRKNLAIPTP